MCRGFDNDCLCNVITFVNIKCNGITNRASDRVFNLGKSHPGAGFRPRAGSRFGRWPETEPPASTVRSRLELPASINVPALRLIILPRAPSRLVVSPAKLPSPAANACVQYRRPGVDKGILIRLRQSITGPRIPVRNCVSYRASMATAHASHGTNLRCARRGKGGCLSDAEDGLVVVVAGFDINFSTQMPSFVEKDISVTAFFCVRKKDRKPFVAANSG